MEIIVHRGTQEVGGSCIEINCKGTCILVDFGLPLSFEFCDDIDSVLPEPLYTDIVNGTKKIDALLISHAHLDHFGLIGKLPKDIPIYMGKAAVELIRFTNQFTPKRIGQFNAIPFQAQKPFRIGSCEIIPYLMDHAAFDSYGFLLTADHKSIFYTGDFRGHGRMQAEFEKLVSNPPRVDVLLMEGTLIGERLDELTPPESEIEKQMVHLCRETKRTVFVSVPSQNIDRIISIYRAARQTGRKFIIDLHSAELFDRLKDYSGEIPQPSWPDVLLWYPWFQRENYFKNGLGWVMKKHKEWKKTIKEFSSEIPHSVMMLRPPFRKEIENNTDLSNSIWVYSMWRGYLERSDPLRRLQRWTEENGIQFVFLHTSGHANIADLKRLEKALSPQQVLIPVHSYHGELFSNFFEKVRCLNDGERFEI